MFSEFLLKRGHDLKSEFFIPLLIDELISSNQKKVEVLRCHEEWFGVTYQADKPFVSGRINGLINQGVYPQNLWAKR